MQLVPLQVCNVGTALAQSQDHVFVVERERDVSDFNILNLVVLRLLAFQALASLNCIGKIASSMLLSELLFDLFCKVVRQGHSWRDALFVVAARLPVLLLLPCRVELRLKLELDRVVARRYRRHVPLDLLYLATLEQVAQRDCEEVGNETAKCNRRGHLEVLAVLVIFLLDARELGVHESVVSLAFAWYGLRAPKICG